MSPYEYDPQTDAFLSDLEAQRYTRERGRPQVDNTNTGFEDALAQLGQSETDYLAAMAPQSDAQRMAAQQKYAPNPEADAAAAELGQLEQQYAQTMAGDDAGAQLDAEDAAYRQRMFDLMYGGQ